MYHNRARMRHAKARCPAKERVLPPEVPDQQKSVVTSPLTVWPDRLFDRVREEWGDEPFERPPQGDFEVREDLSIEDWPTRKSP